MEELKTNNYLKGIVLNLPESPGIYQYLNAEGTIIYVGKAKNLKRRVSSYFNREHEPGKTRVLVSKIADIRYIVVNTEEDALLLENNLIKKYKPRYNVLLKDDKTYPSICVQNEYFPRVFKTRRIIRNGSSYYGPYSHIPSMYAVLDLIKHLYPLRTCNLNLSPENIRAGKFNVCLEYHIKNCAGPCIGKQNQEEYLKNIAEIKEILKGNTQEIERMLYQQMQELAAEMKFEEAQKIKEKYLLLENYRSKSEVVSNVLHNIDVFSIEEDNDEKSAFINYLHITNGAINQAFTFEYKKRLNETKEELLSLGIIEMRERYKSLSREIIVPFELDMELKDVTFTIPQRGDKKKLLELSILNVKQYKADRLKQAEKLNPEQRTIRLLKEIQQ
ncbi:excinuclease ABC subunit UvrC, partial [Bacteroides clarus]